MNLPREVSFLCNQYLEAIKQGSVFKSQDRLKLYRAFGSSKVDEVIENEKWWITHSVADKAFGWLAILTAEKVLPIWEKYGVPEKDNQNYSYAPNKMLIVARGVLNKSIDADQAKGDLREKFYFGMSGISKYVTETVYYSMEVAYIALELAITGLEEGLIYIDIKNQNQRSEERLAFETDEDKRFLEAASNLNPIFIAQTDFAVKALIAFAAKDINEPGKWSYTRHDPNQEFVPLKNDPPKELEFWEWWLTEAIPKAWELAQQSASSSEQG